MTIELRQVTDDNFAEWRKAQEEKAERLYGPLPLAAGVATERERVAGEEM